MLTTTTMLSSDSMGITLSTGTNNQESKCKTPETNNTNWNTTHAAASSWSSSFQLLQFTHSLNYCLKKNERGVDHLNSLSMINKQTKKRAVCNNFEWVNLCRRYNVGYLHFSSVLTETRQSWTSNT